MDWRLEQFEGHAGVQALVRELNRLYRAEGALHLQDFHSDGFEWIDCHDPERTILAFLRWAPDWEDLVIALGNFTPVLRERYVLPVPFEGRYRVVLDTGDAAFGGDGSEVPEVLESRPEEHKGRDHVVELPLPGLSMLWLKREEN